MKIERKVRYDNPLVIYEKLLNGEILTAYKGDKVYLNKYKMPMIEHIREAVTHSITFKELTEMVFLEKSKVPWRVLFKENPNTKVLVNVEENGISYLDFVVGFNEKTDEFVYEYREYDKKAIPLPINHSIIEEICQNSKRINEK